MKKTYTKLILISIVYTLVISAYVWFGIQSTTVYHDSNSEIGELKQDTERLRNRDEIGDVEGYGILVNSLLVGVLTFGAALIYILLIISTGIVMFMNILMHGIARLFQIGKPDRWKAIASIIVLMLAVITEIVLMIFIAMVFSNSIIWSILVIPMVLSHPVIDYKLLKKAHQSSQLFLETQDHKIVNEDQNIVGQVQNGR